MARTAEYSIKGYLYQFLSYLSQILSADALSSITIEGAIEDIDVNTPSFTTAVQCKYHEQSDVFTLGKIYKPILLMLEHFSKNPKLIPKVYYRLYCHFPNESGARALSMTELEAVLATEAKSLKPIVARITAGVNYKEFLERFTVEFGQTVDDLQKDIIRALATRGFSPEDSKAIIFPNAIQRIVDLATKPDIANRTVDPVNFVNELRTVRHVTFTRWSLELATREQIFKRMRRDLRLSLGLNARSRVFVLNSSTIVDFDKSIVRFIKKFVEHYSCKFLHSDPPLFMISGISDIKDLEVRLDDVGLRCANGLVGATLKSKDLFRKPMIKRSPFTIEFSLRLACRDDVAGPPPRRLDELFLINVTDDPWEHTDVNVHRFEIDSLSDLEFVLQLRNTYA